jgi:hypothetical protein
MLIPIFGNLKSFRIRDELSKESRHLELVISHLDKNTKQQNDQHLKINAILEGTHIREEVSFLALPNL